MRWLGERAFARYFDIEMTLGLHDTEPDHAHPGPGNHRGSETPVESNYGCQPLGIGWPAVVMGLGKAVLCQGESWEGEDDEGEADHERGSSFV